MLKVTWFGYGPLEDSWHYMEDLPAEKVRQHCARHRLTMRRKVCYNYNPPSTRYSSHTPPTIDPTQLRTSMVGTGLPTSQCPSAPLKPGYLLPTWRVRAVVADAPIELVVTRVVPRVLLGRPPVRGAHSPRRARRPTRCRPRRGVPPSGGGVAATMVLRGRASRLSGVRGPTGAPARRSPRRREAIWYPMAFGVVPTKNCSA